jgi:hypothetical protein
LGRLGLRRDLGGRRRRCGEGIEAGLVVRIVMIAADGLVCGRGTSGARSYGDTGGPGRAQLFDPPRPASPHGGLAGHIPPVSRDSSIEPTSADCVQSTLTFGLSPPYSETVGELPPIAWDPGSRLPG